jgi:hypothetical protein
MFRLPTAVEYGGTFTLWIAALSSAPTPSKLLYLWQLQEETYRFIGVPNISQDTSFIGSITEAASGRSGQSHLICFISFKLV